MQRKMNSEVSRRNIRLSSEDYFKIRSYFITCCSFENDLLFGKIQNQELKINAVGNIISEWWLKIPTKFSGIELGEFVVMPNHFHGIIKIVGEDRVGEEPWLLPLVNGEPRLLIESREETRLLIESREETRLLIESREETRLLPYKCPMEQTDVVLRVDPSIPRIMQWFKAMSTNEYYRLQRSSGIRTNPKLWQRSYYDHIIRSNADYHRISDYIRNNPSRWIADRFNR